MDKFSFDHPILWGLVVVVAMVVCMLLLPLLMGLAFKALS
jgi:hypothetical protein